MAREHLNRGHPDLAVQTARRSLAALGDRYAVSHAIDDTALKLAVADDLLKAGKAGDAVETLLRVVEARTRLFLELHSADGVE